MSFLWCPMSSLINDHCPLSKKELRRLYQRLGSLRLLAKWISREFADHFGNYPIAKSTVNKWMKDRGIPLNPRGGRNNYKGR